jgi:hypothetical protein
MDIYNLFINLLQPADGIQRRTGLRFCLRINHKGGPQAAFLLHDAHLIYFGLR